MSEIVKEIEKVFYIKINDDILEHLKKTAINIELHEQHEICCFQSEDHIVRIRVRMTNGKDMVYTMKPKIKGVIADKEYNRPCDQTEFNLFKLISSNSFIKNRYTLKSSDEDIVFEVDVFNGLDGKPINWAKVDIELKSHDIEIPKFPFPVLAFINRDKQSPEEKLFVGTLYNNYNLKYKG